MITIYRLFMVVLICLGTSAFANSGAENKGTEAKTTDSKQAEEAAPPPAPKDLGPKRYYNPGNVEKFPSLISAINITTNKPLNYKPKRGRATMVIFIASWCEPCQQLMPKLKNLAGKYDKLYTDVIYVFSHDTKDDASGFVKEHKLAGRIVLSNQEILQSFKNPALPAIYIGDRYNYLSNRALAATPADLDRLDSYLEKVNAF
jgi:thiol-disulfide isomerase/thioredoxin